ncbi:hypothetical protein [Okeania sp. SIO2C9]|nr:hypothetical protein [Okeania sp. SIO2C9]
MESYQISKIALNLAIIKDLAPHTILFGNGATVMVEGDRGLGE